MKVAVLGVGLMGGSIAAALRKRKLARHVVGFDLDPQFCARGIAAGLLDESAASPGQAARGADLVALAVPVGSMSGLLTQIAGELGASAIVTDLGSTKSDVVAAARLALGPAFERFVPSHPIAGGERPGLERADPDLFEGRTVVTTPVQETSAQALAQVEQLWRSCGARVERMQPDEHDRILASVSHLPHVLAFALIGRIAGEQDARRKLSLAGPGFRDFSRIAASSPRMWRDVVLANRDALGQELDGLVATLQRIGQAVSAGDGQWLQQFFQRASDARRRMDAGEYGE